MAYVVDADDLFSDSGSDEETMPIQHNVESSGQGRRQNSSLQPSKPQQSSPWAPSSRQGSQFQNPKLSSSAWAPSFGKNFSHQGQGPFTQRNRSAKRNRRLDPNSDFPSINRVQTENSTISYSTPGSNTALASDELEGKCPNRQENASTLPPGNRSVSQQKTGPVVHPDRQHLIARHLSVSPSTTSTKVRVPKDESSVASILPDDGLRSKVLAGNDPTKADSSRRKRPSSLLPVNRSHDVVKSDDRHDRHKPSNTSVNMSSTAACNTPFGDLASIAAGVVSGRGGTKINPQKSPSSSSKPRPSQVVPSVSQKRSNMEPMSGDDEPKYIRPRKRAARAEHSSREKSAVSRISPHQIYIGATLTKKDLEEEARKQEEEQRRIERAVQEQRQRERKRRRIIAAEMSSIPTVSAASRDAFQLDRVERHLFNDDSGRHMRDSLGHLGLVLKDPGSDLKTQTLWTITMEDVYG